MKPRITSRWDLSAVCRGVVWANALLAVVLSAADRRVHRLLAWTRFGVPHSASAAVSRDGRSRLPALVEVRVDRRVGVRRETDPNTGPQRSLTAQVNAGPGRWSPAPTDPAESLLGWACAP